MQVDPIVYFLLGFCAGIAVALILQIKINGVIHDE